MIITQNVASKLVVSFVAVAMLFSLSFAPVKAATADELQAQITALLAQIATLQGQVGQGGSTAGAGVCPYTWSVNLKVGSAGADVMTLQKFLNSDAETRVSASGVGSAGMETMTFGPMTGAAVSKFQTKYRADILTPNGLVSPTGMFGPSSRAKANALCSVAVVPSDDDANDDANDDSGELSGEASLKSFDIEDGDDTELEEGQTAESVTEFIIEFEDGDAMITRLDVNLDAVSGDDAWDIFGDVTLSVDGEEVMTIDGSDEDSYQDDEKTLRFSGLDIVANEDEEITVTLGVEVQDNLDTSPDDVDVDVLGMRFVDGDGVTTTEDDESLDNAGADSVGSFSIDEAGFEDELIVKSNSSDPDSTTLIVKDDVKSDWLTVFIFDLDTDDSTNDIELNNIVVTIETDNSYDIDEMVYDAELIIDGETYDNWDFVGAPDDIMDIDFDIDGDHTVDAGDRVEAELRLRFTAVDGTNYEEGDAIRVSVNVVDSDAEGADDVVVTGAAASDPHTLRSAGLVADASSVETDTDTMGENDTTGVFTISFDVEALEGDFYVDEENFGYDIDGPLVDDDNGVLTSTGNEDSPGVFTVSEGTTETFTLTVTITASTTGQYRVSMLGMGFSSNPDGVTDAELLYLFPEADYRTGYQNINN